MGKIAYGRRRTEKKAGTRNETHVVEQSDFLVYEGVHEAIIAEEDWELAQEKRSKNNYRREKIHDPEYAHILSGILKCPCCGKGMYGNIAKAGRKDNKTRYYYYCKNTVNATGHKCTFRRNIEQSQNEIADNMYQRSELDYLIYNDSIGYADLILNGDPEIYLKTVTEYKPLDS